MATSPHEQLIEEVEALYEKAPGDKGLFVTMLLVQLIKNHVDGTTIREIAYDMHKVGRVC